MKSISYEEFLSAAEKWCENVADGEAVEILSKGKKPLLLISREEYEWNTRMSESRSILSSFSESSDPLEMALRQMEAMGGPEDWQDEEEEKPEE